MVTSAKIGYGTTFKWGSDFVAELTRVGAVSLTASKQDATTLGSADSYRDMIPGLIDPGDLEIEGWFRPDDTAQAALVADMNSRTSRTFIIAFPTSLSTTTWTGTAYVTGFVAGDATPEGIIPFSATLSIVGKPTLGVTASTGMSALTGIEENVGASLTFLPTFAIGTFNYTTSVNTASNWIQLTPTASGHTITITVLGVESTVTSGNLSGELTIGGTGTVTEVTIKVVETDKSSKTYTLWVSRP